MWRVLDLPRCRYPSAHGPLSESVVADAAQMQRHKKGVAYEQSEVDGILGHFRCESVLQFTGVR